MWLAFISNTRMVSGMLAQIELTSGKYLGIQKVKTLKDIDVLHSFLFASQDNSSRQRAIVWARSKGYKTLSVSGPNG